MSVTGMLLGLAARYRVGEFVEWELDYFVRPEAKTMIRGVGRIVRKTSGRVALLAIQFGPKGTSIVRAKRESLKKRITTEVTENSELLKMKLCPL
jgi:hypothetical protein